MANVLIIGGNHGLGLEWVKYYLNQGNHVTATYRDFSASTELFAIQDCPLTKIECDVTNTKQIESLTQSVSSFDIIIYNAGTKGYSKKFSTPDENTDEELDLAYSVNCKGLNAAIRAFLPKILKHPQCKFIYMSTGVSSIQDNASGNYHPYRISKLAGNQTIRNFDLLVTKKWIESDQDITLRPLLFALTPGMVDIGMAAGVEGAMPVDEAIRKMIEVINHVSKTQDTHGLWSYNGKKIDSYVTPQVLQEYENKKPAVQETKNTESKKNFLPLLEKQSHTKNKDPKHSVLAYDQKAFSKIGLG